MAEKLKEFDFSKSRQRRTDGNIVYHWDDWFNGDVWLLKSGEDFLGHPLMMERISRTRATNFGAKIKIAHVCENGDGDKWGYGSLVLQRVDIIGPSEAKRAERRAKLQATREAKAAKPAPKSKRPVKV